MDIDERLRTLLKNSQALHAQLLEQKKLIEEQRRAKPNRTFEIDRREDLQPLLQRLLRGGKTQTD